MRKPSLSLRRRRDADPATGAEPDTTVFPAPGEPASAPAAEPAPVGSGVGEPGPVVAEPVVVQPDPAAPAGVELLTPAAPPTPSFRERGRLRRRLRYLRRVRELAFRDLGGLVFDLHRFGRDGAGLVTGKVEALGAVDRELRALEEALEDRRDLVVLREPGMAACPRCAALHGSDANFCPNCGLAFSGPQAMAPVVQAPAPPAAPAPAPHPQPTAALPAEQPTTVQPALPAEQLTTVQPALPGEPGAEPGPARPHPAP